MKRFNNERLVSKVGINLITGNNECRLETFDGAKVATFLFEGHCQSAAHAINNHDALVEALSDALEMAEGLDVHGLIYLEQQEKWERLVSILEKAKGES